MFVRSLMPAFAVLSSSALVLAADASTSDLRAQIDALQQKVDALEARQARASEVNANAQRVLDDAERRSQLSPALGFTSGFSKGKFVLQSADGNYSFTPTAQFQFRYAGSYREDAGEGDASYEDGFELRRMKFGMAGNVVSRDLTYKFQWGTDRGTGGPNLEDAWFRYNLNKDFAVFAGQFEDLTSHESLVSSARQLAAEQSYANRVLIDAISEYVQGVGVTYSSDDLRVSGAFSDGANSDNTSFQDQALSFAPAPGAPSAFSRVNWGASARGEYKILGDNWKQYDDFSALGNRSDLLVLGSSIHYSQGDDGNLYLYSADLQYEPQAVSGLSLFAALLANNFDGDSDESATNTGWVLQAGYLLNPKWELFARYDQVNWDQDVFSADGQDSVQEYTAGVNYFISGHAAKITADLTYLPDGAPRGEAGLGILPQSDEAQGVARVQFQLLL